MTDDNIFKTIRYLAKSDYHQMKYTQAKEIGLKMFQNDEDLSSLQNTFLNYLLFYSNIYMDIAIKEVGEIVLENEIYEDAWAYYKRNKPQEEKIDIGTRKDGHGTDKIGTFQWVFKRPNKEVK